MQYGCEVYMNSYMASMDHSFKNHLLEVGVTQNHREIMVLRTLTTVDLFGLIMCEDPCE